MKLRAICPNYLANQSIKQETKRRKKRRRRRNGRGRGRGRGRGEEMRERKKESKTSRKVKTGGRESKIIVTWRESLLSDGYSLSTNNPSMLSYRLF